MYRTRSHHKEYLQFRAQRRKENKHPNNSCILCEVHEGDKQFVSQTKYFKIMRNLFPYSIWDQQHVSDHLMIVPIKHAGSLTELPKEARLEFIDLISEYEITGYNVYARATESVTRTIAHQHTHLIKCEGPETKFAFYTVKPYINVQL